jgi:hypothetical protein
MKNRQACRLPVLSLDDDDFLFFLFPFFFLNVWYGWSSTGCMIRGLSRSGLSKDWR